MILEPRIASTNGGACLSTTKWLGQPPDARQHAVPRSDRKGKRRKRAHSRHHRRCVPQTCAAWPLNAWLGFVREVCLEVKFVPCRPATLRQGHGPPEDDSPAPCVASAPAP